MFSCPRAPPIRFSKRAKGRECESSSRISDIKSTEVGVKTKEAWAAIRKFASQGSKLALEHFEAGASLR